VMADSGNRVGAGAAKGAGAAGSIAGGVGGEAAAGGGEFFIEFSDYKKTPDGYVFPYTVVTGGMGAKMNVERVEVNRRVDVDGLSRPK